MSTSASSIIDAIDAAILAMMAGGGAQTVNLNDGRSVTYYDLGQLRDARKLYEELNTAGTDNERRFIRTRTGFQR